MTFSNDIGSDFNKILKLIGQQVRFRYFTTTPVSAGSGYDDSTVLTVSGTDLWASGVVQLMTGPKGNDEQALWEQGRIRYGNNRLYVAGNVQTSGQFKVWIGSPVTNEFSLNPDGIDNWNINGIPIYKKLYMTYLPTGSLIGE